jgi:hypothetical protein
MAQLFGPKADAVARLVVFGAIPLALCAWGLAYELYGSSYTTRVGMIVDQPVPFSHEHHARQLGIDCRYCHASAENAPFAGMPSSKTCMTCHSQVWKDAPVLEPVRDSVRTGRPIRWARVTKLPDYVYFDHSIHMAKGLSCADCHGRVDLMPLTYKASAFRMKDCLSCHRDGSGIVPESPLERYLGELPRDTPALMKRTPDEALTRLVLARGKLMMTDCYTCHR